MKKFSFFLVFLFWSCDPWVTEFPDIEEAILYESSGYTVPPEVENPKVMTWNIRFGAARIPWFGDSCGDRVIMTEGEVLENLQDIADFINSESPDILLLQEVDVLSKRSAYLNQVQWLLDHTHFNYGAYASMWQAQFIPSDGLGRVDVGNVVLSRWKITDAERIQLPLRTDQDGLTQYFYLRRNILKTKIDFPGQGEFYTLCTHTTAFATDDTKQKHIESLFDELNSIDTNAVFIAGGDLNSVPPGAETDFCMSDICSGESFHTDSNGGPHKEGSYFDNFIGEPELIQPLYDSFNSAIDNNEAILENHFTHATWNTASEGTTYWDRKLDYIFSNAEFSDGITHQEENQLSDHAPVSAILEIE